MKVAFLNGTSITSGTVNYVAAIGITMALEYNYEIVLGSNYISNHMLQNCFSGKMKENGITHSPYRFLYGSTEYCRNLWSMKGNRQSNILELPMEGVTIVYPPEITEKSMFYYDVPENAFYLLDTVVENKTVFQNILEEADILVVFLPQDVAAIQNFFHRFSSVIPNALFVIEETTRTNRLFYRSLLAENGIDNKDIISISKCREHKNACEEGRLPAFLKSNQATRKPQYKFVSGVKTIARILYEYSSCGEGKEGKNNKKV